MLPVYREEKNVNTVSQTRQAPEVQSNEVCGPGPAHRADGEDQDQVAWRMKKRGTVLNLSSWRRGWHRTQVLDYQTGELQLR